MNNLSSYCGLVDARISASDKYLPVCCTYNILDFLDFSPDYFAINVSLRKLLTYINCDFLSYINLFDELENVLTKFWFLSLISGLPLILIATLLPLSYKSSKKEDVLATSLSLHWLHI